MPPLAPVGGTSLEQEPFVGQRAMTIGTVLLDLDGVLMDHRAAVRAALRRWLGDRATPAFEAAWFAAQDLRLAEWRAGISTWQEQRRDRLRDVLPLLGRAVGTPEELDAVFAEGFLVAYGSSWRAFPDARLALDSLRANGFGLAVLTNGSEQQQMDKLRVIGLADAVGPVFTAEAIGAAKPAPKAFLAACDALAADPATVLYVGDKYEVDVLGARAVGMHAVLLDRDGTAPAGEGAVITTLADLPDFLVKRPNGTAEPGAPALGADPADPVG